MGKGRGGANKERGKGDGTEKNSNWHPSLHQAITKSTLL